MKTYQEIIDWINETSKESMQRFNAEPYKLNNPSATAYMAEAVILKLLKEFIES